MPVTNDSHFRHLKAGEKDYKRSDSGGLFMLVTKTGGTGISRSAIRRRR
jgi:hypothetical protein